VFWIVMSIVAACLCVAYGAIGLSGDAFGIGQARRAKFRSSGWLALGWTALCLAHYAIRL
jgi:hypothetical protein